MLIKSVDFKMVQKSPLIQKEKPDLAPQSPVIAEGEKKLMNLRNG
jgi:hypothetical protein